MIKPDKINEAIKFHGHLGPYLILGLIIGEFALKRIGAKKHFGLEVKVYGANERPKSCLIDGLQLSTGATFGKGNIHKFKGKSIKVLIRDLKADKEIVIFFKPILIEELNSLTSHRDSENFARKLSRESVGDLFKIKE